MIFLRILATVTGTVAMNSLGHDATTLSINFPDYNVRSSIVYPAYHAVSCFNCSFYGVHNTESILGGQQNTLKAFTTVV